MSSLAEQTAVVSAFPREVIRPKELAVLLGISEAALSSQRRRRTGPPAILRQGCRPYYHRDEVVAWLLEQAGRNARWAPSEIIPAPSPGCVP